ncbi:mitochondrial genome maintenance exonuclease 1 isoform X2 [Megalopta genalis]|uniref:mitochondrial genome maintenance exonuclease 1 isoform X2 n=1 Tax=Megalopta genalis TaxID=115081 RepID=UPI003FD39718
MRCTMINNKHLLHSLLIYRFNISCISQQCSRNLSFKNSTKYQSVINDERDGRSGKKTFTALKNTAIYKKPVNTLTTDDIEKITSYSIFGFQNAIKQQVKRQIPSVSTILNETMSPCTMARIGIWRERMISEYGQEEFDKHSENMKRTGRLLHSYIHRKLLRKDVVLSSEIYLAYLSVRSFLSNIQNVQRLETVVTHPALKYKGVVDCIGVYRNEVCVIDWKKSDKQRSTLDATYDAALRLSANIGAVNASHMFPFVVTKGLLVIAYSNGDPAHIHEVKDKLLQEKWTSWLERLKKFYEEQNSRSKDGTVPDSY